ncbi:MAG: chemotaxis protein CheW [Bacteriovoracaceae bacterium]
MVAPLGPHYIEVIPVPETTIVPNVPQYFVGIMNLRGQIISIIDLRKRLKIEMKKSNKEEAVVIVDLKGISIGLVVDSINKVLTISLSEINEIPEVSNQINTKYIIGVYKHNEKLTMMLDLESILSFDEIKKVAKKAA